MIEKKNLILKIHLSFILFIVVFFHISKNFDDKIKYLSSSS